MRKWSIVCVLLTVVLSAMLWNFRRHETELQTFRISQIAYAVAAYHETTGQWPQSVDDLLAAGVAQSPGPDTIVVPLGTIEFLYYGPTATEMGKADIVIHSDRFGKRNSGPIVQIGGLRNDTISRFEAVISERLRDWAEFSTQSERGR